MILITRTGEFLLYFTVSFSFVSFPKKKKKVAAGLFFFFFLSWVALFLLQDCLNCDQMEKGEQYSEYSVERNPRAYMSMRDYRNLPLQN